MKKHIFALFAVLSLVSGSVYAYDADGNANRKRAIDGAPAWVAYREYQLVRYPNNLDAGSNTPLSAGDVVVWDCVSDDGVTVNLVGSTNSADAVAGVVVSTTIPSADVAGTTPQTDFGRRNWGYIQVRGLCTNVNTVGQTTAGVAIKASDTARNADTASGADSVNKGQKMGFAMDTGFNPEVIIQL